METKRLHENIANWEELEKGKEGGGEIESTWTQLGHEVGTKGVGLNRVEVAEGKRTTAFHVHGAEEEIFYILGGAGTLYQGQASHEVRAGDCIVHLPGTHPHCLRGGPQGLDVLVFGTRVPVEICYLPRAGMAWAGPTVVAAPGIQDLWAMDAAGEPLALPPGPRPKNLVALESVPAQTSDRKGHSGTSRRLGVAAGSRKTGLNHVSLAPGSAGPPAHCHSAEEEIFVVQDGEGVCVLGETEIPVRRGHVVARPPGTRIAHALRAGAKGLTYLAYGTREPNDIAYYPRSKKVFLRGVGVIGRIEALDYWDGEV
jgi:uncharacterized cupin superfamily protein